MHTVFGNWNRFEYLKTVLLMLLASLAASEPTSPQAGASVDVTYRRVGDWHGQLDIYAPASGVPRPVLIYFHGGEWQGGSRKSVANHLAPYLSKGFVAVAVSFRGSRIALAPAAVTDARCALHWVINNASSYGIDRTRIVLSGHSAGGHLALITGYLTPAAGLDGECRSDPSINPAAVVAWNAPSNLREYMSARLADGDPIKWLRPAEKTPALADAVSPISYARAGRPPTLSVHAIGDPEVPHSQAAKLHARLQTVDVPNELVTLQSNGHLTPQHPPSEVARAYARVFRFLCRSGVLTKRLPLQP